MPRGSTGTATSLSGSSVTIGTVDQGNPPWTFDLVRVGGTAVTLGQKAMTASIPVVLSSDQTSIPVAATLSAETTKVIGTVNQGTSPWVVSLTSTTITGTVAVTQSTSPWVVSGTVTATPTGTYTTKETRAATSTVTQVGDSASSVTLLASNANRLGVSITNLSSAILYIKLGTTASATDNTAVLYQNGFFSDQLYTGRIDGIWASDAGGVASITELTA